MSQQPDLITCPGCRRPLGESQFYRRVRVDGREERRQSSYCVRCNDRLEAAIAKSHRDSNERARGRR